MASSIPGTDPSRCVLDTFRAAIAKRVADALPPLTIEQAYSGVDYGKKGVDFTVALPRFRLPGKVDELAGKVIAQVCGPCLFLSPSLIVSSFNQTNMSPLLHTTKPFFTSSLRLPPSSEKSLLKSTPSLTIHLLESPSTAQTYLARGKRSSSNIPHPTSQSLSMLGICEVQSSARFSPTSTKAVAGTLFL